MDNSNPIMNEMIAEMRFEQIGPLATTQLCLYNRIKPFVVLGSPASTALAGTARKVVSYFQNVLTHDIDAITVTAVNAGTNWRDKYNFIEIKPQFQDDKVRELCSKVYSQGFDSNAFQREGFRPMIFSTKYLPGSFFGKQDVESASYAELSSWVKTLQAWYFDTHKMLNGTINFTGMDEYIGVGDNIMFDAQLINPNKNFNLGQNKLPAKAYVLCHVESVNHNFTISAEGARSYSTSIQFVRGIIVDENKVPLAENSSAGAIDNSATKAPLSVGENRKNVITKKSADGPKITSR